MDNSSDARPKSGSWIDKLKSVNENKTDTVLVLLFYIVGVIFYFFLSNFKKTVAIYLDEMLYYDIARSIFRGEGILVRGVDAGFTKIGYSLLIAPLFAIDNVELRITMISLLNSVVIMSSVFPAYYIAKKLNLKRGVRYLFLLFLVLSPTMLFADTFMSEVLYMPLVWLFVLLWIKEQSSPEKIVYPISEGIICFWGYLTKEIFLSVFITYFLVKIIYPFITAFFRSDGEKEGFWKTVRSGYSLKTLKNAVIFGAIFILLYAVSLAVFSDENIYGEALSRELNLYNLLYLAYCIVFYLAGTVIATLVFPLVYPLLLFKKQDDIMRRLICFVYFNIPISIAAISYTVLLDEDVGNEFMRIHFRYISPYLLLVMLVFLVTVFDKEKVSDYLNSHSATAWWSMLVAAVFGAVFFKGIAIGSNIDQYELGWFRFIEDYVGFSKSGKDSMAFPLYSVLIGFFILVFVIVGQLFISRKKFGKFYRTFAVTLLLLSSVNLLYGHTANVDISSSNDKFIGEIQKVNGFIENLSDDERVLYIINGDSLLRRYADTYIDKTDNIYFVSREFVSDLSVDDHIPVGELELVEADLERKYAPVDRIDYIVWQRDDESRSFTNVEILPESSSEHLAVFRNLDNTALNFQDDADLFFTGIDKAVSFGAENSNISFYIKEGLSSPEDGFSRTLGNRLVAEIPVVKGYDRVCITLNCTDTYNGTQRYVVRQGESLITEGEADGAGIISFIAVVEDKTAAFEIYFPDAVKASDVLGNNDDSLIAVALGGMEISVAD